MTAARLVDPDADLIESGPSATSSRTLYRRLAAGVTVVTSGTADQPAGLTASAVTSLSLAPSLLLACVGTGSRTLAAIERQRTFAVNLLRDTQRGTAERFAGRSTNPSGKFDTGDWWPVLGVPVLRDVLAWAVCFAVDTHAYGDHVLVVGRVAASRVYAGAPLLWHDGRFRTLAAAEEPNG